ncbi:unnamed protein product [Prunus armeniaca]
MYIFGHQPPNIDGSSVELGKETDTYMDANTSISDPHEDTSLAFADCHVAEGLNGTLITLVPKVVSSQTMAQFRPISLCCTLYKVLSKIIVARLRPLMSTLISPNQVSFVPGRQITDNILVAQELMHKFKNSKGRKDFIAWKVDLSKAYDRLNWNFIRKKWKPVKSSQSGPLVSHLFFAYDLILFTEASTQQARVMKDCLEKFYRASSQTVNLKSLQSTAHPTPHLHPQGLSLRQGQARAATIHMNSVSLCICGSTHEGKRDASADVTKLGLQPRQKLPLGLLGLVGPTTKPGYGPCAGAASGSLWQPFPQAGPCSDGSTMGSMGSDDPTADLEFSGRDWFLPLAAMEVTPWRRRRSFGGGSWSKKKEREEKE